MGIIAQRTAELISGELEKLAGTPEKAARIDLDKCWEWGFAGQVVHPLAYFSQMDVPGNCWFGNRVLFEAACAGERRLIREMLATENHGRFRRSGHPMVRAFTLLRKDLDDRDRLKADVQKVMRKLFMPLLEERECLTILSSANVDYGTNHLACEFSALSAYVCAFRDDPDFSRMDPGGAALVAYAKGWLARFMAYMDEGGYWPETDGPANAYNTLTASALLRAAIDLGEVERYRSHFERAAHFHTRYMLPNFRSVGVTDGRNHQIDCSARLSYAGFLPEGKAMLEQVILHRLESSRKGQRFTGELLNEFLTDILAEPFFAAGTAPVPWDQAEFTDTIRGDFAVLKRGPWIGAVSNQRFRPRPEGHWTLDHQNLFSLYHSEFGIVLSGSNSKNDPELATFNKQLTRFDGKPLESPMWSYVPGRGQFDTDRNGVRLMRDYRGFEGYLEWQVADAKACTLQIRANARMSVYPITCSLQPAAGYGRGFKDAAGKAIEIAEKALALRGKDLGGVMVLAPEAQPDIRAAGPGRPVRLTIPDDAEVIWPFKAWDCYNEKTDRYEKPESWTLILKVPVGPDGAKVGIEVM